ncbi:helix-turn-helix domain-containing protein [Yinghuangia aomiensis]|uniref:Helix-turn-helix domain-containing protein n=1 Tax=Yinghuangia aomiensis TaxID=676205 RepID=A0ABP9GWK4_9ACTN
MVKRTRFDAEPCPVARSVDAIGDWWSLLIVRDAFDGSRRFGDFQRGLGIAKNILTARLRGLVDAGILDRQPAADGSPYQEYVLTPRGRDLFPVVVALRQWGERHFFEPGEPRSELLDRRDGKPLAPLEIRAADGRRVEAPETEVRKVPEGE